MNKKLFLGAMALTVVTVAGVRYYTWIKTKALELLYPAKDQGEVPDEVWEPFKDIDRDTYPEPVKDNESHG